MNKKTQAENHVESGPSEELNSKDIETSQQTEKSEKPTEDKGLSESDSAANPNTKNVVDALSQYWKNLFNNEIKKVEEEKHKILLNLSNERDKSKRLESQIASDRKYDGKRLAKEVLATYDNLSRAIESGKEATEDNMVAWVKGIEVVYRELQDILKRNDIVEIKPKVRDLFDHNLHEAIYYAPVPGYNDGEITEVRQTGFKFHDRLLRPAKVGVADNPSVPEDEKEITDSPESSEENLENSKST